MHRQRHRDLGGQPGLREEQRHLHRALELLHEEAVLLARVAGGAHPVAVAVVLIGIVDEGAVVQLVGAAVVVVVGVTGVSVPVEIGVALVVVGDAGAVVTDLAHAVVVIVLLAVVGVEGAVVVDIVEAIPVVVVVTAVPLPVAVGVELVLVEQLGAVVVDVEDTVPVLVAAGVTGLVAEAVGLIRVGDGRAVVVDVVEPVAVEVVVAGGADAVAVGVDLHQVGHPRAVVDLVGVAVAVLVGIVEIGDRVAVEIVGTGGQLHGRERVAHLAGVVAGKAMLTTRRPGVGAVDHGVAVHAEVGVLAEIAPQDLVDELQHPPLGDGLHHETLVGATEHQQGDRLVQDAGVGVHPAAVVVCDHERRHAVGVAERRRIGHVPDRARAVGIGEVGADQGLEAEAREVRLGLEAALHEGPEGVGEVLVDRTRLALVLQPVLVAVHPVGELVRDHVEGRPAGPEHRDVAPLAAEPGRVVVVAAAVVGERLELGVAAVVGAPAEVLVEPVVGAVCVLVQISHVLWGAPLAATLGTPRVDVEVVPEEARVGLVAVGIEGLEVLVGRGAGHLVRHDGEHVALERVLVHGVRAHAALGPNTLPRQAEARHVGIAPHDGVVPDELRGALAEPRAGGRIGVRLGDGRRGLVGALGGDRGHGAAHVAVVKMDPELGPLHEPAEVALLEHDHVFAAVEALHTAERQLLLGVVEAPHSGVVVHEGQRLLGGGRSVHHDVEQQGLGNPRPARPHLHRSGGRGAELGERSEHRRAAHHQTTGPGTHLGLGRQVEPGEVRGAVDPPGGNRDVIEANGCVALGIDHHGLLGDDRTIEVQPHQGASLGQVRGLGLERHRLSGTHLQRLRGGPGEARGASGRARVGGLGGVGGGTGAQERGQQEHRDLAGQASSLRTVHASPRHGRTGTLAGIVDDGRTFVRTNVRDAPVGIAA